MVGMGGKANTADGWSAGLPTPVVGRPWEEDATVAEPPPLADAAEAPEEGMDAGEGLGLPAGEGLGLPAGEGLGLGAGLGERAGWGGLGEAATGAGAGLGGSAGLAGDVLHSCEISCMKGDKRAGMRMVLSGSVQRLGLINGQYFCRIWHPPPRPEMMGRKCCGIPAAGMFDG